MSDAINHPMHYKTKNGMETIDIIEAFTEGLSGSEAFNTGSVLKYMCRWSKKNGLEDLKKAQWYLNRLIDSIKDKQEKEMFSVSSVTNVTTAHNENKNGGIYG